MILKQYNEDDGNECISSDDEGDSDDAPELITSREDFDSMVNTFLNEFEILGRKMKPKLEGESGIEKLDILRRAMGQDERVRIANGDDEEKDQTDLLTTEEEDKKDRWDCETILSSFTFYFFGLLLQLFSSNLHEFGKSSPPYSCPRLDTSPTDRS
jgi:protein LTV1